MNNFPGEINQIIQNGFNPFVFVNPACFHPTLPLFTYNHTFTIENRKENTVFPNQNPSFQPNIIENALETI